MGNTEERLTKVEAHIADIQDTWKEWSEKQETSRKKSNEDLTNTINQLSEKVSKYIDLNLGQQERIKSIKEEQDILRQLVMVHEKSVSTFDVYLKSILENLKEVNLSEMKSNINQLFTHFREISVDIKTVSTEKKEQVQFCSHRMKEIEQDVDTLEKTAGKIAIKAWLWIGSIVITAITSGVIAHFITTNME